jgi:malate dehydrogenase (oxaloacetate-decarboxylating)
MLVAAVNALAAQSPALKDPDKGLLPDVVNAREISVCIAMAVVKQAIEEGLAQEEDIPIDDAELEEWIREQMWQPEYRPLRKVEKAGASRHARGQMGIAGNGMF